MVLETSLTKNVTLPGSGIIHARDSRAVAGRVVDCLFDPKPTRPGNSKKSEAAPFIDVVGVLAESNGSVRRVIIQDCYGSGIVDSDRSCRCITILGYCCGIRQLNHKNLRTFDQFIIGDLDRDGLVGLACGKDKGAKRNSGKVLAGSCGVRNGMIVHRDHIGRIVRPVYDYMDSRCSGIFGD